MPKTFSLQKINECKEFIRNHHGAMTNDEMAAKLGVGTTKVVLLIRDMKMATQRKRKPMRQGKYFNIKIYRNWLTGF